MPQPSLPQLARDLASGATTSRKLVEDCLARIADPAGEGHRAIIMLHSDKALLAADAHDALRKAGASASPWAGIPIVIKDLADIAGDITTAGSKALADGPFALADAPVVARLRRAGFVLIGRANMTEFAYSGLGINPHYGTPLSPWDRATKRVPGGSSSGSAVAVADGFAHGALGTDTGGSCRIPAAFNAVTGLKPTARRVPAAGVVPLSTSLDSIGPIARSVDCCAAMDGIMAGETQDRLEIEAMPLSGLRLHVPETIVLDGLDSTVSATFDAALKVLATAGAHITRSKFTPFDHIADASRKGGLSAAESWAWHRTLIEKKRGLYDPRVLARILRGTEQTAADYIDLLNARDGAVQSFNRAMTDFDAILSPTVPVVPPRIADVAGDDDYTRINMLVLRNTLMLNVVDGCSIALPMSAPGSAPASLMISAPAMRDHRLMAIAKSVERALGFARA